MDVFERLHVVDGIDLTDSWPPRCVSMRFRRYRAIVDVLEQVHVAYGIDLTDFLGRKTSRRCVDAVTAPLPRFFVEVFHLLVTFSIVDWIVDDQLMEWHQVQAL